MNPADVTFRRQVVDIETRDPTDEDKRWMDIIEITYPDGKVVAFPADHKSPETGERYRDMFSAKYAAFKNGNPDPDRVALLNREIAERQAELDSFKRPKDDKRVQENLGYGVKEKNPNASERELHDNTKRLPGEKPSPGPEPIAKAEPSSVPIRNEPPKSKEHA